VQTPHGYTPEKPETNLKNPGMQKVFFPFLSEKSPFSSGIASGGGDFFIFSSPFPKEQLFCV